MRGRSGWGPLQGERPKANNRKTEVALGDFVSIGAFTVAPLIITVPVKSPWKTIEDLIRDAKANPGKFAYASGGLYRIAHINTELFAKAVGLKFRHVPYAGGDRRSARLSAATRISPR